MNEALDWEKYCFEHLPEAVDYSRRNGRTGTEAWVARRHYEVRLLASNPSLSGRESLTLKQ